MAADFLPSLIVRDDSDFLPHRKALVDGLAADASTAGIPIIRFAPSSPETSQREECSTIAVTKPIPPMAVLEAVEALLDAAHTGGKVAVGVE